MTAMPILARRAATLAALGLAAGAASPAAAQERLLGVRAAAAGPYFEVWNLDYFSQPSLTGAPTTITQVTQLSVPVTAIVPIGTRFSLDVSGGFATGTVKLAGAAAGEPDEWSLSGLTDTKVRFTGKLAGDNVVFTLGANAPTGQTDLDEEEYAAARVLASPALGLRVPVLGNGAGYTAGVVAARDVGGVSVAFGASYEARTSFSPIGIVAGLPALEYNPSDAVRLSLMTDAIVGRGQMRFGVGVDAFTEGEIETDFEGGTVDNTLQLGPVVTAEWHWAFTAPRFRAVNVSVVDRYRTKYERDGEAIEGSDANYLDVAMQGLLPIARRTDLVLGLDVRHQTGLDSDATLAAAAFAGGGVTLGLSREMAGGLMVQPMLRATFGSLESAGESYGANGFGAGIIVSRRF